MYAFTTIVPLYNVGFSKDFLKQGCALLKFNLWLTGLMLKVSGIYARSILTCLWLKALPCFLLFWFTIALLIRLRKNERRRRERFFRAIAPPSAVVRTVSNGSSRRGGAPHTGDRTTYVLLLMLSVFLLTELPQGLFAILNGYFLLFLKKVFLVKVEFLKVSLKKFYASFFNEYIYPKSISRKCLAMYTYQFHGYVYMSIADVLDLLSLINCYVAFAVYVLTSSEYRRTLFRMSITSLSKK